MRVDAWGRGGAVEEGGERVGDVRNRHEVERFGFLPFEQDEPLGEIKELQTSLKNQCPRTFTVLKDKWSTFWEFVRNLRLLRLVRVPALAHLGQGIEC